MILKKQLVSYLLKFMISSLRVVEISERITDDDSSDLLLHKIKSLVKRINHVLSHSLCG